MKKILIGSILALGISTLQASSLEVGLGNVQFDYSEYLDDGSWFNSEKSEEYELDGGFIKYEHSLSDLKNEDRKYKQYLEVYYSFHLNRAEHTQPNALGTPTDNELHQGHLRYKAINKVENYELGIFVGLGYRYWDRDMLGSSNLRGYLETYEWPYYEAGLSWKWYDGNFYMGIDASFQKAYKPTMIAYTKNISTFGRDLDFDLGDTQGYKIDIPLGYKVNENWDVVLHYVYDAWDIEKSNELPIANGSKAWEPFSETRNSYTYISLKYKF